jgi:acetyl-CoA carboxylase biotin carboxylase subunit
MRRALGMFVIEGIETTVPLHLRVLSDPDFLAGRFTTGFLERFSPV